jgi:phosphocarrier protein HPr
MEKSVKLLNEEGLHARPAGIFVKTANAFKSSVQVKAKGQSKNGKSIMSLMGLGVRGGDEITIETNGEDAEALLKALIELVENKFNL